MSCKNNLGIDFIEKRKTGVFPIEDSLKELYNIYETLIERLEAKGQKVITTTLINSKVTDKNAYERKLLLNESMELLERAMIGCNHSEMIALTYITGRDEYKMGIPGLKMVSRLDMCYQCEKACVHTLPKISSTMSIQSSSSSTSEAFDGIKILVGSYERYDDSFTPANRTRNGSKTELLKAVLKTTFSWSPPSITKTFVLKDKTAPLAKPKAPAGALSQCAWHNETEWFDVSASSSSSSVITGKQCETCGKMFEMYKKD